MFLELRKKRRFQESSEIAWGPSLGKSIQGISGLFFGYFSEVGWNGHCAFTNFVQETRIKDYLILHYENKIECKSALTMVE